MVERPLELSLSDLYLMRKQEQVTEHYCIQGWTAIAEWAGVPMQYIISLCKPYEDVRYVVFHSYQYTDGDEFYEVLDLEIVKHPQTILAYEMNGEPLNVGHGAPLRLRGETQLGYKMVKWLKSIELLVTIRILARDRVGIERITCIIVRVLKFKKTLDMHVTISY